MEKRGRGRPRKKIVSESQNLAKKTLNLTNENAPCSDVLPEFFKIYTPALSSETMLIPPDFVDKVGVNIATRWTLRRRQGGASWQVETNTSNGRWFFEKGWPEFVHQNSLRYGDFMTFCFVGNSTFSVTIFSSNGCTKGGDEYTRSMSDDETSESGNSEINESAGNSEINESERGRRCSSLGYINGNPFFQIKIQKSYVIKGNLLVPMEFWIRHINTREKGQMKEKETEGFDSRMVTLWVKNESWSVKLVHYRSRILLQRGLPKFYKDNCLKMGTSCTFQLIDAINVSFKVTIHK